MEYFTSLILSLLFTEIMVFLILYVLLMQSNSTLWIGWTVFAGAFLVGIILSYVVFKRKRFAALIVGLGSGAALSCVLQVAVVYMINFEYSFHIVIGALTMLTIILS
jgi:hypothetical protein